jgi:hypothetical protein
MTTASTMPPYAVTGIVNVIETSTPVWLSSTAEVGFISIDQPFDELPIKVNISVNLPVFVRTLV